MLTTKIDKLSTYEFKGNNYIIKMATEVNNIVAIYTTIGSDTYVSIKIKDSKLQERNNSDVYFCVDTSGSMAGTPIRNVNDTLTNISNNMEAKVLYYSNTCTEMNLKEYVSKKPFVGGSTFFSNLFNNMTNIVKKPAHIIEESGHLNNQFNRTAEIFPNSHTIETKNTRSALCILLPDTNEHFELIDNIRREKDSVYNRWPAHINLSFPFVDVNNLDNAADILQKKLKNWGKIRIVLDKIEEFKSKDKLNIHLEPRQYSDLTMLYSIITQLGFEKNRNVFLPHMTIAQTTEITPDTKPLKWYREKFTDKNVSFDIDKLYIVTREYDTKFSVYKEINLT